MISNKMSHETGVNCSLWKLIYPEDKKVFIKKNVIVTLLGLVQRPDLVLKKRNSKKTSLKFISEESALIQPVETISKTHVAGRLYKNTSHLHLFQSNSYSELLRLNLPFQVKRRMRITCTSSSRNP